MESARHRVTAAAELAAGVQDGEDHLDSRLILRLVEIDRNAATVVDDPHSTVFEHGDQDGVAVSGESLVDRIIHDLVDEVVKTAGAGGADIHAWALAYRLETLKHLDLICSVAVFRLRI